jgi:hypothetical protein
MPQPNPSIRRDNVYHLRLSDPELLRLRAYASALGVPQSEALRIALLFASKQRKKKPANVASVAGHGAPVQQEMFSDDAQH